jgi:hypothetical protein
MSGNKVGQFDSDFHTQLNATFRQRNDPNMPCLPWVQQGISAHCFNANLKSLAQCARRDLFFSLRARLHG